MQPATPTPETVVRQVRLRIPDPTYRKLKHRLADRGPAASLSDVVLDLLEAALALDSQPTSNP